MGDVVPLAKDNNVALKQAKHDPTLSQLLRREAAEKELEFDPNYLSTEYVDFLDPHDVLAFKNQGFKMAFIKICDWQSIKLMRRWTYMANPSEKHDKPFSSLSAIATSVIFAFSL